MFQGKMSHSSSECDPFLKVVVLHTVMLTMKVTVSQVMKEYFSLL